MHPTIFLALRNPLKYLELMNKLKDLRVCFVNISNNIDFGLPEIKFKSNFKHISKE
jgi:hypothetical protein